MDELYDQLIDYFDIFGDTSKDSFVSVDGYPGAYMFYNAPEEYGVFINCGFEKEYCESCSGVRLESKSFNLNGIPKKGYCLTCYIPDAAPQFSMVCADFLRSEIDIKNSQPSVWFDKWKEVLGNTTVLRPTYQIIGELIILKDLINHGYSAQWGGPEGSVCDLVDPVNNMYFEVKSTIVRNSSSITLSEEFQAKKADYLCFCRFEEDLNGSYSIDSVCESLIELGYDKRKLETGLKKLGIRDTSLKTKRYHLLEMAYYPVNGNLPDITQWFVGGVKPGFIEKISYTINLSNLYKIDNIPPVTNNKLKR